MFDISFMILSRQILGIQFFNGDVDEAVALMFQRGGFLVAPSGTCFARLREDASYRRAVLAADLAIADSGLMVVAWRLLQHESVQRISGLKYLKHLLENLKGEGINVPFVRRIVFTSSAGGAWPACFSSAGFGSNVSTCEGPPFINR